MEPTESAYKEIEERFAAWAQRQPDIRAAFVVGSRARADDHPADEWADLDIIMIANRPERYLASTDWLESIGKVWVTSLGRTVAGEPERLVLFEGGLAVDFVVDPYTRAKWGLRFLRVLKRFPQLRKLLPKALANEASRFLTLGPLTFGRGVRVLFDKAGLVQQMRLVFSETASAGPPRQAEFLEVINRFWLVSDRVARKLGRGELGVAMSNHAGLLYQALFPVIQWHARATRGWDYDTWHGERFLEEWADPRAVEGLRSVFAHYDAEDMWRALLATMNLFRWLALETAERLGYPYPTVVDERVTEWVRRLAETRAHGEDGP